jgi:hypothetical protein
MQPTFLKKRILRFSRWWRFKSRFSGLWRPVVLRWDTNVSEDLTASIFRVNTGMEVFCLHLQGEYGGSTVFRNVGIFPQHLTESQIVRLDMYFLTRLHYVLPKITELQ